MQLADKVALVTGGGEGIGKASAQLLAREGARVAVLGHSAGNVEEAVSKIQRAGGDAMALVADVAQADQMQAAINQIADKWGRLDIVFANAGINGVWAPLEELTPDDWQRTIQTNLTGTFLTVKYAVPYLKKQGGSVIITSSINGTRVFSNTGATAYAASKAGQVAFAKMVALELAKWRVRVNAICPGAISTSIDENTQRRDLNTVRTPVEHPKGTIPLTDGQPGTPEDVAQVVLFLASDASRHISGTEVFIDGAQSLLVGS
ncbi:MAG TPA: SDR family NAD(P)-dependent oxidoreductase [Ktedonobacterales bacterium]